MKISRELVKGSTAMLVLKVISEGEAYGYEILQKIARRSEGALRLAEGGLYPVLHAMEKERWIEIYEKESPTRRVRKYYRITSLGATQLSLMLAEWKLFSASVESVLGKSML